MCKLLLLLDTLANVRSMSGTSPLLVDPGKFPIFGVRENPKICPQIRKLSSLKSARIDDKGLGITI